MIWVMLEKFARACEPARFKRVGPDTHIKPAALLPHFISLQGHFIVVAAHCYAPNLPYQMHRLLMNKFPLAHMTSFILWVS